MSTRRKKHAVFDIRYHLVWIPKYRKHILKGEDTRYTKEVLQRVAKGYVFWVDTMEVMEAPVHISLGVPPKYPPAEVVQILKSVSEREVFKKFRILRRDFSAGEFWSVA
jgi:putative transposase